MIVQLPFHPQLTLQSASTLGGQTNPLRITLRTHRAHADDVFRLRYKGYERDGHLGPSAQGTYSDSFDSLQSTIQITAHNGRRLAGVLRLCYWHSSLSGKTLPCEAVYPEVAGLKAHSHGPIIEIGRLTIDPDITNCSFKTTLYAALVRSAVMMCLAGNVETVLAGAPLKTKNFYLRILGFSQVGEPRLYPPGSQPIFLLARKMELSSPARIGLNPFFNITAEDIAAVRKEVWPATGLPA